MADDTSALRAEAVISIDAGGDDIDMDPSLAESFDGVVDEAALEVLRVARVGGRENRDPHGRLACMGRARRYHKAKNPYAARTQPR
jgi:hypothetical protein